MKKMRKQLIKLLNIHGVSGKEGKVRDYLYPILKEKMDDVKIDSYGNLLAEKKYGSGKGATVMLSAHMDTVKGVLADRKIIQNNDIITSNKGALGADDRAGIAIILSVLRNMKNINFNGTIKIAFSREEEIGCIGSDKIDFDFYKDVNLAIIVDRRGSRDIVVGGAGVAFCSNEVGYFMEDVSKMSDMNYKCTEGGISDALTFAENGVNSINLSAGYMNEHTENEYVSVNAMKDTTKLMLQAIAIISDHYHKFGNVKKENEWVKSWYKSDKYSYDFGREYFEDVFLDDCIYGEEYDDSYGDTFIYEIGEDIMIQQGTKEILVSRESFYSLVNQVTSNMTKV